jgi:hypothetical protein
MHFETQNKVAPLPGIPDTQAPLTYLPAEIAGHTMNHLRLAPNVSDDEMLGERAGTRLLAHTSCHGPAAAWPGSRPRSTPCCLTAPALHGRPARPPPLCSPGAGRQDLAGGDLHGAGGEAARLPR